MLKDALVGSVFKVTELRTQSQLVTGQTAARLALGKPGNKAVQPTTGADFQPGRQMQQARGVDIGALRSLASSGQGRFRELGNGDADLRALLPDAPQTTTTVQDEQVARRADQWVEYAPWLIPLLMVPALLLFRRGVVS